METEAIESLPVVPGWEWGDGPRPLFEQLKRVAAEVTPRGE